jgi:signal transduction histidine kinase
METVALQAPDGAADPAPLDARLRSIRRIAVLLGVLWVVAVAACTQWMSHRIVVGNLADAFERARSDAEATAGIVDHLFHELGSIALVLASGRDLHTLVARYDALEGEFSHLPLEQRVTALRGDPAVARVNERMTRIRNSLDYDLIYALDNGGIRIASSEWDRPQELLGVQLSDRAYFKSAMAGTEGFMFGVGRTTRIPAFFFSAPIEDEGRPIGVVVVREDAEAIGIMLRSSRRTALLVDGAGMVVASSAPQFLMRHVGAIEGTQPSADALRDIYGETQLRSLAVARPRRALHENEWRIGGFRYLVTTVPLKGADYRLFVLTRTKWLTDVRVPHYIIGALAALFGIVVVLLGNRRASDLAHRRHEARILAALNQKLSALNVEKDRYVGIAAHDLRNPLSSMRGLSQLMLEMPLEPEQQREFLETISRTSDEMLGLVNDLLDVSVIESGRLELRRSEQDVTALVRQRIRHLEPHAQRKSIELHFDGDAAQSASIDPARFSQVIDNLVSNAIKFSPSGTTVKVTLRSVADRFEFSVQDQGPGISDKDKELLFRSFQKLSARPTGGEKSTGLGLAIVKRIVDAHDGSISVANAPGGGACFTVSVPRGGAPAS